MNTRIFTGYIPSPACDAWTPATGSAPARRKVLFDVVIHDSEGFEFPDHCVIDDDGLIAQHESMLTSGRAVIVEGEQTGRQMFHRGVFTGIAPLVRVKRIEFPRARAALPQTAEAKT